ncbi:hypothetical protein LCGC14_0824680 [marine sediment metagenome]|uniref:Uncharacterized protein n=1 Tax=marine sediment metagenome TaxID=412755 RepID=A0A0F9Q307_9ZZZZ
MTKIYIIPEKIPNHFWERDQYEDIILYALGVYGPLKREEFINNNDKGIKNRMNKNTFHKWAKKLKNNNYIIVSRKQKYSIYTITNLGINKLLKRLKAYNLDVKTILELEQKAVSKKISQITPFFKTFDIINRGIMIEFLKLKNEISREKFKNFTEEKLDKLILYLILNHPKFYDASECINISIEDFIKKYSKGILSKEELKLFLQKINVEKINEISFYRLKLIKSGVNLYFRSTEEYGRIFEITIQAILREHYYLQYLLNNSFHEIIINEICEEVLSILIDKYNLFHKDLETPLYNKIKHYLLNLLKNFKKNAFVDRFDLNEIPTLMLTSRLFEFERLDYLQKKALFHLEKAYDASTPFKHRVNLEEVKYYIQKAIEFDNSNSYNYALKAQYFHLRGWYENALEAISKAIKINPLEADYYSDLEGILLSTSQYEEALEAIRKAIELDPKVANYYSDLASVLSFLKQYEDAIGAINMAIKIDPQNIKYYIQKSQYLAYYLYKYKNALKVIEAAFKLNPDKLSLFDLYEGQAGILLSMKNREEAIKIIRKARLLCPNKEIYPNLH